ncbi:MAG: SPASM domain-containing protein [Proteobacteria bacterium]|nr:SPASM domain-containing protein [Pseudomonadota bacterium]
MESIYYVMSWACHRRCKHCYEDRFRPYNKREMKGVLAEAVANYPRIVDNLPDTMMYRDRADLDETGAPRLKVGRVILSGGESLLDPIRENVTYKVIERLRAKYADRGGVKIVVQTTGDLVTPEIVDDLLARGVWMISCAGLDDFHVNIKADAMKADLTRLFESKGMAQSGLATQNRKWLEEQGPVFSFFGATPDTWIGKIWPRGRAWDNDLSHATIDDNFCARWSGGLDFLRYGESGAEISVEPDGSVYPCCIKTKLPIGNLTEDRLADIIDSLRDDPVFQAISAGEPQKMGLADGWDEAKFVDASRTKTKSGRDYQNLCIGCDKFFEAKMGTRIDAAKARRRAMKEAAK